MKKFKVLFLFKDDKTYNIGMKTVIQHRNFDLLILNLKRSKRNLKNLNGIQKDKKIYIQQMFNTKYI